MIFKEIFEAEDNKEKERKKAWSEIDKFAKAFVKKKAGFLKKHSTQTLTFMSSGDENEDWLYDNVYMKLSDKIDYDGFDYEQQNNNDGYWVTVIVK